MQQRFKTKHVESLARVSRLIVFSRKCMAQSRRARTRKCREGWRELAATSRGLIDFRQFEKVRDAFKNAGIEHYYLDWDRSCG